MLKTSIRYFAAVVQHGSIRAAADSLLINQSAISRQLQSLEEEFGVALLERHARGARLTDAGEILFAAIRDISFSADRMRSEIDALQGLRRGHIRIHTVESLVHNLVPQVVARFHAMHPGIRFEVVMASSNAVSAAVYGGQADIGIAYCPPPSDDLKVVFRWQEKITAIMRPDHPLAKLRQVSVRDLTMWPLGIAPPHIGARQLFDAACRSRDVTIFPILETNSVELLHRFALVNDGVAITSKLILGEGTKNLVSRPIKEEALDNAYFEVLTLARRKLPLPAEKFLTLLRRELDAAARTH